MLKPNVPQGRAIEEGMAEPGAEPQVGGVNCEAVRSKAARNIAAVLPILQRWAETHGVPEAMRFAPKS